MFRRTVLTGYDLLHSLFNLLVMIKNVWYNHLNDKISHAKHFEEWIDSLSTIVAEI